MMMKKGDETIEALQSQVKLMEEAGWELVEMQADHIKTDKEKLDEVKEISAIVAKEDEIRVGQEIEERKAKLAEARKVKEHEVSDSNSAQRDMVEKTETHKAEATQASGKPVRNATR